MPYVNKKSKSIFLIGIAVVSCLISPAGAEEHQGCSAVLPRVLNQQLRDKFPGWRPKRVSDLGADDKRLWLKASPKECPGAAAGHFKDSNTSYALLLVREWNPTSGFKLLVAAKNPSGDDHTFDLLDHNDSESAAGMVISKLKPGGYSDVEQTRTVTTKLDSINVEWIEAAAVLYYWSGHRYRMLQIAD